MLGVGLVFWLIALLGLNPFLHTHVGDTATHGFHIDGLTLHSHDGAPHLSAHAHPDAHAASAMGTHAHSHAADAAHDGWLTEHNSDSPAIGVAASLPNSYDDTVLPLLLAGLLIAWWAASTAQAPARLAPRSPVRHRLRRSYRPGAPPPAQAPPSV